MEEEKKAEVEAKPDTNTTPLLFALKGLGGEGKKAVDKEAINKLIGSSLFSKFSRPKKVMLESIYEVQSLKVKKWKLRNDSVSMGFAVYLKPEFLQMNFSSEQRSDVLMNSIIVHLVQIMMIVCIWNYAWTNDEFAIRPVKSIDMMICRFLASVMMHINVEKDVQAGIKMMKYVVNHHENFTNPYPPFFLGLVSSIISLIVEVNVMIILTSMSNVLSVINKYVSLAAIVNVPRFYYSSLVEHRTTGCNNIKLDITRFRHQNNKRTCTMKVLHSIYKLWKMIFSSISFYFMPFTAIFLNFGFMISSKNSTNSCRMTT